MERLEVSENKKDNIDQIREIVFGQQMKLYEDRFQRQLDEMTQLKADFENKIKHMNLDIKTLVGNLESDLREDLRLVRKMYLSKKEYSKSLLEQSFHFRDDQPKESKNKHPSAS